MRALLWTLVLAGVAFGAWRLIPGGKGGGPPSKTPRKAEPKIGRFPLSQFYLQHDYFLPATDPRTVPAAQAAWLRPDDEVFGVVLGRSARAYPVPMISYHHVVNDVIDGIPVAVTY